MSEIDASEQFLAALVLPEEDVDLGGGLSVRVRGLSHDEVMSLQDLKERKKQTAVEFERNIVAAALVSPAMTYRQVERFAAQAPAGAFLTVSRAAQRLSGLEEDARKSGPEEAGGQPAP